jgi:hypothetical protein
MVEAPVTSQRAAISPAVHLHGCCLSIRVFINLDNWSYLLGSFVKRLTAGCHLSRSR